MCVCDSSVRIDLLFYTLVCELFFCLPFPVTTGTVYDEREAEMSANSHSYAQRKTAEIIRKCSCKVHSIVRQTAVDDQETDAGLGSGSRAQVAVT